MQYVKPTIISMKNHPEFNERWVQERIAADPSILQLGDVVLKDKERSQPPGGKLDLLLQSVDEARRYEVEIQLGASNESHIIRTIEYWDVEKRRYPQYEHCAVLVAEDITSRFLNVVSLFNGSVPIIALQMHAVQIGDAVGLLFIKVVDHLTLGMPDEDEEVYEVTDRNYWVEKASETILELADKCLQDFVHACDPSLELKYNKHYIGLTRGDQPFNFIVFRPKRAALNFEFTHPRTDEIDSLIDESQLETLEYNSRRQTYRIRLTLAEIERESTVLKSLTRLAFERRN